LCAVCGLCFHLLRAKIRYCLFVSAGQKVIFALPYLKGYAECGIIETEGISVMDLGLNKKGGEKW